MKAQEQKVLKSIKDFKNMLESRLCHAFDEMDNNNFDPMDTLYSNLFTLSFMGKECKLYFGPCEYDSIIEMLNNVLEDMQA